MGNFRPDDNVTNDIARGFIEKIVKPEEFDHIRSHLDAIAEAHGVAVQTVVGDIAGFAAAADLARRELDRYAELARLRDEVGVAGRSPQDRLVVLETSVALEDDVEGRPAYLARFFEAERRSADRLRGLLAAPSSAPPVVPDRAVARSQL